MGTSTKEVLSVHIGQAGIQIGEALWELYCLEHGINPDGTIPEDLAVAQYDGFSSFFQQTPNGVIPASFMVDSEPTVIDQIKKGRCGKLFHPASMRNWKEDAASNFARGFVAIGQTIIEDVIDDLRKIVENCDQFQGFMLFHSICGGTGSGFAALLIEVLSELFPKKTRLQFLGFPSPKISTTTVEPYNAVLATHLMLETCGCSFMTDNESLFSICENNLGISRPSCKNVNRVLVQAYSSITANQRFDGVLNMSLADYETNLVPFPRVHFPVISYAPLTKAKDLRYQADNSIMQLTNQCLEPSNLFVKCDIKGSKFISCCLLCRGSVTTSEIMKSVNEIKSREDINFVSWSPAGFKGGVCYKAPTVLSGEELAPMDKSTCLLANSAGINATFTRLNNNFDKLFSKKAFVHWYEEEGCERAVFKDARDNMAVLESEYMEISKDTSDEEEEIP